MLLAHRFKLLGTPFGGLARGPVFEDHLLHGLGQDQSSVHDAGKGVDSLEKLVAGVAGVL